MSIEDLLARESYITPRVKILSPSELPDVQSPPKRPSRLPPTVTAKIESKPTRTPVNPTSLVVYDFQMTPIALSRSVSTIPKHLIILSSYGRTDWGERINSPR